MTFDQIVVCRMIKIYLIWSLYTTFFIAWSEIENCNAQFSTRLWRNELPFVSITELLSRSVFVSFSSRSSQSTSWFYDNFTSEWVQFPTSSLQCRYLNRAPESGYWSETVLRSARFHQVPELQRSLWYAVISYSAKRNAGVDIVSKIDRCREYRELQMQLASPLTDLTMEQKQRLHVNNGRMTHENI